MSLAHLTQLARLADESATALETAVSHYVALVKQTLVGDGKLLFAGNGGSAAHAQHIAAEYVVRYRLDGRRAAPALALTVDTSVLTAAANDLGYEQVFARQVGALATPADLLVLISTSGNSPNLLRAAETARARGVRTAALLGGSGGRLRELVDLAVVVPSSDAAHVQEIQLAIDHLVCGMCEGLLGA